MTVLAMPMQSQHFFFLLFFFLNTNYFSKIVTHLLNDNMRHDDNAGHANQCMASAFCILFIYFNTNYFMNNDVSHDNDSHDNAWPVLFVCFFIYFNTNYFMKNNASQDDSTGHGWCFFFFLNTNNLKKIVTSNINDHDAGHVNANNVAAFFLVFYFYFFKY